MNEFQFFLLQLLLLSCLVISGVVLVIFIIAWNFFIWYRGLGNLTKNHANEIFGNSKIENDESNEIPVTGVTFFRYLKIFLDTIDCHALNCACTSDVYHGIDRSGKGGILKDSITMSKALLFENPNPRNELDIILDSKSTDENISEINLLEDNSTDLRKAKLLLSKIFTIHNPL